MVASGGSVRAKGGVSFAAGAFGGGGVSFGVSGGAGDWVHAYLHRKEGDLGNAGYWYRRARKPVAKGPLDDEWAEIVRALL